MASRDSGADEETHAKGDANQPERFGAIFRFRHVRDVGLRQRQIAGGDSINGARKKDQPQRVRVGKNQKTYKSAHLAHQQQRTASHMVR